MKKKNIIIARFLSVVFALVFVFSAFSFANTKATEAVFKVQNASISELSNDATGEVINYDDGNIESSVRFYHRGDSAKYNIELKNTDSKSHKIISISDESSNPYIEYTYDTHENHELAAGESFNFELLATYANAVEDLNSRDQQVSIKLIITYEEEQDEIDINPDESPNTGDKIGLNVVLMVVSAIGLLVCVFISRSDAKSKKKPVLGLIIALSLALTATTNAVAVLSDEVLLSIDFGLYDKIVVNLDGQEATIDYDAVKDLIDAIEPSKTGYIFDGWQKQDGSVYSPADKITGDVEMISKWTPISYKIEFQKGSEGNPSGVMEAVDTKYDESVILPECVFGNTGWHFVGWEIRGQTYEAGAEVKNLTAVDGEMITAVAKWAPNTDTAYTVVHKKMKLDGESYETVDTENLSGTTGSEVTPVVKDYAGFTAPSAQTVTIAADGSTRVEYKYTRNKYDFAVTNRENLETDSTANGSYYYETEITVKARDIEGHTFAGWNDGEAEKEYTFALKDNKTLTANYTVNKYTITFDTDGGSEISSITQDYDSAITPPAGPTKTGYDFTGWDPVLPTKMPAQDLTVKATWTEKTATLSYNANGHGTAPESVELKYTQSQIVAGAIESGDEYSFEGWNTKADGTGDSYEPGDEIKAANVEPSNIALYAQWTTMRSITFHYGDHVFDGQSYLNTNFKPFSLENFNVGTQEFTDFDISFNIDSMTPKSGQSNNRNVIVSSLDEETKVDNVMHYIGFDFRYLTNSKYYELESASNRTTSDRTRTTQMNDNFGNPDNYPWHVELKRSGTQFGVNGQMNMDYAEIKHNHNVPLTFGAQIQKLGNMQAWRYFIGEMSDIELTLYYKEGTSVAIPGASMSKQSFDGWNTKADGSGEVKSGTIKLDGDIDLYAIWDSNKYTVTYDYGDLTFDGQSYLNTGITLFSEKAIYDDFDLSLTVANSEHLAGQDSNLNTVFNALDESGNPYPGMVFRRDASRYSFTANASSSSKFTLGRYEKNSIHVTRLRGTLSVDGYTNSIRSADFTKRTDTPLSFGASLKSNGDPWRYFKGSLSSVVVSKQYGNTEAFTLPTPSFSGSNCTFVGWSGNDGDPQYSVIIESGNQENKRFKAVFSCQ